MTAPGLMDRLGFFTFLWACQALVHQEYFQQWLHEGMWLGWLLTGVALYVLLHPRQLAPFALLLVVSVAHNVERWPFVVNHILVEGLINVTILLALAWTAVSAWRRTGVSPLRADLGISSAQDRDAAFKRFAPVLMVMMVVMYYYAFLAKLNSGFFDPALSCTTALYADLIDRFPLLPTGEWVRPVMIWATIAVEGAIPVLFTFRRTRTLGILVGVPFHLMLGLIGYRTFAAIVYVLYFLFLSEEATAMANRLRGELVRRLGPSALPRAGLALCAGVIVVFLLNLAGYSRAGIGPIEVHRLSWLVWIGWSLAVGGVYFATIATLWLADRARALPALPTPSPILGHPGPLWAMALLVVINGSSQYVGLKTETCFTMYSNLQTEGGRWNHLIVPSSVKLASFQDDLVEIVESDHPALQQHADARQLIEHFELQRIVSRAEQDLVVTYRRDGEVHRFELRDGVASDPQLRRRHPIALEKLLYFRPVPIDEDIPCMH